LVTAALALTVLVGFAGLGVDLGVLRHEKRLQQSAADAAALAGAQNLSFGDQAGIQNGGHVASASNGFADNSGNSIGQCTSSAGVGTICVQVNWPPQSGPHTNDTKYVEAYVAAVQPTYFVRIFGVTRSVVTARAVATGYGHNTNQGGCLFTLGPPCVPNKTGKCPPNGGIDGININGNGTLNAPTCGINDNGDYNASGKALTVNAGTFAVAGQNIGNSTAGVTCTYQAAAECPAYNAPSVGDPLATTLNAKTAPTPGAPGAASGGCALNNGAVNCNGGGEITPGTYSSISIGSNGTVTFDPGVYVLTDTAQDNGGLSCNGNSSLQGNGVMFYFMNNATVNCQGTSSMNFTAPSPDNCPSCPSQYDGILMWQDGSDGDLAQTVTFSNAKGPRLGGTSGSVFNGTLYFPSAQVTFYGNDNTSGGCGAGAAAQTVGILVSDALALSGRPNLCLLGSSGLPPGTDFLKNAILVE
jgi:hypothetical protein